VNPDEVIARFRNLRRNRRGWTAQCPAHDDRANSLSLAIGDDHRTLLHCFANCSAADIAAAVGLTTRDLFANGHASASARSRPRALSPLDEARRDVLRLAQQQPWARDGVCLVYELSDWLRWNRRKVRDLRRLAVADTETTWEILARAARVETFVHAVEDELDDVVTGGARW
jgi:hypothetical protein